MLIIIMWNNKRPNDDLNFYSLLGIVQSGMWLQADIEKYLQQFDLSYGRFSIMLSILEAEKKVLKGSELAEKLGISKTTVSKMIQKLLSEDLIEFDPPKEDQREKYYHISGKGKSKLNEIIPGYLERMRIIGSSISVDEKRCLLNILGKINFIESRYQISKFSERPLSEKTKEIQELCQKGTAEAIDKVMDYLDETTDIPTTKIVDYYLGTVDTLDGMKRIEYYLFNGTQIQRNYSTLFFVRINDWRLVNKAYKLGLIDYIQAYSK